MKAIWKKERDGCRHVRIVTIQGRLQRIRRLA